MEGHVDRIRASLLAATSEGSAEAPEARAELAADWPEVVALCSVDPVARAELDDLQERVAALGEDHEWAYWIGMILGVLHDDPFVAVEPSSRTGIAGRMSGVVENFQLQTLLMDAFPQRTARFGRRRRRVSRSAAAIARGDGPQQTDETIVGAWNLYTYRGLTGGSLPRADDLDTTDTWIWGEGTPTDIPILDGHRVILLGESAYTRTWGAQRMFPDLRATLDARKLDGNELGQWLQRIEAAASRDGAPES